MGLKINGLVKFVPSPQQTQTAPDDDLSIANASYSGTSFSVSGQDGIPTGVTFNSTGTKMFMVGDSTDSVYQYSLSIGFDVSSASYDNISFAINVSAGDDPRAIAFNSDGTKMFVVVLSDTVYQYSLSTGFDLSTASYSNISYQRSLAGNSTGIAFSTDGTKMFIGTGNEIVFQFTLSSEFDLSTASYDNINFDVASVISGLTEVTFNSIGTKMFITSQINAIVAEYDLSTGYDLNTASYTNVSFDVSSQENNPNAVAFDTNGVKMYIAGAGTDTIYEYNL